jgi:predicted MFS family arabinose efflux permease
MPPPISAPAAPQPRAFPLWAIVLAGAIVAGIGMGLRQIMGLYLKPMTEHLGIGREAFSLAIALANIVWGCAAPFIGAASDKYGAGKVLFFGSGCTAIGLILMVTAKTDVDLLISGVFLGFGVAGAGVTAMVGAIGRAAPPERRTQAISMLGIGSGVGTLVALPYAHLLIEGLGWQASLVIMAITALVMWPLALVVGGRPAESASKVAPQTLGESLAEAFRHPSFLLLAAGFFVCGFQVAFYALHIPAYVADRGFDPMVGVISLTMVGLGNLIGTWAAGLSASYFPKQYTLAFIYLGRCVVFLCFLYLPITPTLVIALSFILGLLWLSTVPLTSSLVATFFGPAWMTMLFGVVFLSHQVGSFAGVWMAGKFFDMTRSYDLMWWISIGLGIFAALVHWPISQEPVARLKPSLAGAPAE